jgi:hypothetical protein
MAAKNAGTIGAAGKIKQLAAAWKPLPFVDFAFF